MIIGVRRPAYFPPLAYMALIHHVDHFVLADTFRYSKGSFQNRSKLRNAQGGHWITIPLYGHPDGATLPSIEIERKGRWQEKHWRSFLYDYRTTMYFDHIQHRLKSFFEQDWSSLRDCTCRSVDVQANLFDLKTPIIRASALDGAPTTVDAIAKTMGATAVAVPEGRDTLTPETTPRLLFAFEHPTYHQNFRGFVGGVTALDLLFNYGPEALRTLAQAGTLQNSTIGDVSGLSSG